MWARHHLRPLPQLSDPDAPAWRPSPPAARPSPRLRVLARLRRPWLDAALAAGADPADSALLAWRAASLVSRPNRNHLVRALRACRDSALADDGPLLPRVPAERAEVERALPLFEELEELLRSPQPIYCPGAASAWRLLADGCGPLYAPSHAGELAEELERILAALRGGS